MAEYSSYTFSLIKQVKELPIFKGNSGKHFKVNINPVFESNPININADLKLVLHYIIMKRLNKKLKNKEAVYDRYSTQAQQLGLSRRMIQQYYAHPSAIKVQVSVKNTHPRVKKFKNSFSLCKGFETGLIEVGLENKFYTQKNISTIVDRVKNFLVNDEWKEIKRIRKEELNSKTIQKIKDAADEAWSNSDSSASLQPSTADLEPYVGIEVECLSKYDKNELIEHLVEKAPLLYKNVRIGYDGSIRVTESYPHAFEFRILCKQSEVEKVTTKFFNVLNGIIKVNRSCGLHVHLDMRNRNFGRSYERLFMSLPVLASMIPSTRREDNTYCKLNKDKKGWADRNSDRYYALNSVSYSKFKTLEVRMHSATTNPIKVINWIRLLTIIIDKDFGLDAEPQRTLTSLFSFFSKYDVPSDLRNYITGRIVKFGRYKTLKVPKELEAVIPSNGTDVTVEQDEQDEQNNIAV